MTRSMRLCCKWWWVMPVALAGFACSNGNGDDDPTLDEKPNAGFTIEIAASANVPAGGSSALSVGIRRTLSNVGAVTLAVGGQPPGLSAAFAQSSVTGDATTLTLTAAVGAPVGTYPVWLRGIGAHGAAVAAFLVEITAPGGKRMISGRIVDLFRQPVSGLAVHLGEIDTATDADGRFVADTGPGAYDVRVRRYAPSELHLFAGLTRPDPELMLASTVVAESHLSTITGTLSGAGTYPQADGQVSVIAFVSEQGRGDTLLFPLQGPSYGPLEARWFGDETAQGQLVALQWQLDEALFPDHFVALGTSGVTLTDGATAASAPITMEALGTGFLSGEVVPATDFAVEYKTLWLELGPWTAVSLAVDRTDDATFTYAAPDALYSVGLEAQTIAGDRRSMMYRAGLAPSEIVELAPPAAPRLALPVHEATGVSTSPTVTWTPYAGAIHVVTLSAAGLPTVFVYTAAAATSLDELGATLEPAATYSWGVTGVGPYVSLDDYAEPVEGGAHFPGLGHDILWGVSNLQTFTTQGS